MEAVQKRLIWLEETALTVRPTGVEGAEVSNAVVVVAVVIVVLAAVVCDEPDDPLDAVCVLVDGRGVAGGK